jgi:glycosyltransferase involved in cell wall biosynthesis
LVPMKLLFAIKHLRESPGGAERVLCLMASELARHGHSVSIATFDPPGGSPFYLLEPSVRRLDLGIGDAAATATPLTTLRRMAALRKLAIQERPDVAIGFMHSIFVPLALSLVHTGIPVVASEHIVPEHYRERPLQFALLVATAPFLKKITVLSETIRGRYPTPLRKRMVAVPNAVVPMVGSAAPDSKKDRYVLLNVGRLEEQKDQETLLRAFARLAARHKDWDLRIVGEGALGPGLKKLARSMELNGRVQMTGVTADIGSEYRAADVFVISSRYESFGLATGEAMSFGLPVVGFADCPGTNELVKDGVSGLLAPGGTDRAASLAHTLESLMSNPALRRQLGDAGKTAIRSGHSVSHIVDLWETLLAEVCGRTRGGAKQPVAVS